jgi:hypothetical protein
VPEHLHPLDGAAWRRAILDYASDDSASRAAQLGRLTHWVRPDWATHFGIANALLARLAAEPRGLPARVRGVTHGAEDFPWSGAHQPGTP